jgi:hypothetical protein
VPASVTAEAEAAGDDSQARDAAAVAAELARHGVQRGPADGEQTLRAALRLVRAEGFWSKHYALHPNANRVKMWLWVHERYRGYVADAVRQAEELATRPAAERRARGTALAAAWAKFSRKLADHTEFEETQLLKFFDECRPANAPESGELHRQHSELGKAGADEVEQLLAGVASGAASGDADVDKAAVALRAFQADFLVHLALEENVLLACWLNLSSDEYARYRTYLSFKYAVMY